MVLPELINSAKRHVFIFADYLDPLIYNEVVLRSLAEAFCRRYETDDNGLRIMVHDYEKSAPVIDTLKRLIGGTPTIVVHRIRKLAWKRVKGINEFILVDGTSYWLRDSRKTRQGIYTFRCTRLAPDLHNLFLQVEGEAIRV